MLESAKMFRKNWWGPQLELGMRRMFEERRVLGGEEETSRPAEVAAVLDTEPVDMESETEHVQDMRFGIAYRKDEKVYTGFGTAGKGSEESDSIDKGSVVVVGDIVGEQKGKLVADR